jgi:hypothetical protein
VLPCQRTAPTTPADRNGCISPVCLGIASQKRVGALAGQPAIKRRGRTHDFASDEFLREDWPVGFLTSNRLGSVPVAQPGLIVEALYSLVRLSILRDAFVVTRLR